MEKRRIIAIAEADDYHVEKVQDELDIPIHVIDPTLILEGRSISYGFSNSKQTVYHEGVPLENINSVWLRKPKGFDLDTLPVPDEYKAYAHGALTRHVKALQGQFRDSFWVSRYDAIEAASYKPTQLEVAASLGFNVPETLMTSDPVLAKQFVDAHGTCIVKPLGTHFPDGRIMFANEINSMMDIDFTGLKIDPMIFQQRIIPQKELRIMVIGSDVFAVTTQSSQEYGDAAYVRDSRIGQTTGGLIVEPFSIKDTLAEKCLNLVRAYGLVVGMIDIIIDTQQKEWFLEINPNGEWAGFAETAKLPVARSMARLLLTKYHSY